MKAQAVTTSWTLLRLYYMATALFLLLDYIFGINIRLASLDAFPVWRAIYYVFCFACLSLIWWRPALSPWVGTIESLFTLALLIVTMGVRVMTYSDTVLQTGAGFISGEEVINFVLAGGVAWIAYVRGSRAIQNDLWGEKGS